MRLGLEKCAKTTFKKARLVKANNIVNYIDIAMKV